VKKSDKRRLKRVFIKISIALAVGLLIFSFFLIRKYLKESELFVISRIKTNLDTALSTKSRKLRLDEDLINKENLFSLDINDLSCRLKEAYPEHRDVIIKRRFPNLLYLEFIRRIPFVQINIGGKFWLLDGECIVISELGDWPHPDKITIYPLLSKGLKVSIGKKLSIPYYANIVSLVKELNSQDLINSYDIGSLYAYSTNGISFDLNGVEIRIGSGQYEKKLALLNSLILPRFSSDLDKIEYIDLRFKDYVVGYKR